MHHWVKYCVNRCMKSEVISLASFVANGRTHARTHARTHVRISFDMEGDNNSMAPIIITDYVNCTIMIQYHDGVMHVLTN